MVIQLIAVGTKMPTWINDGFNHYQRRFPKDCSLQLTEIAASKRAKNADIKRVLREEGEKTLTSIPNGNRIVTLEVTGRHWSTEQLANQLQIWQMDGRNVSLLVGGPEGLAPDCLAVSEQRWSLSNLTLPHPLVRVIIAESLYRAWTINQHHPYHRS